MRICVSLLDESFFGHIFKQQIRELTLTNNQKCTEVPMINYTTDVYARIVDFCQNLMHFNVISSSGGTFPSLSLRGLSSSTFSSSTLMKLCINVYNFEDCLSLLDGRLKQLSTLIVVIVNVEDHSSIVHNSVSLSYLIYFLERAISICQINIW